MYAAPKIYQDIVVPTPSINMYSMRPIHDDVTDMTSSSAGDVTDLERRQDKCLADVEELQARLNKIEVDCAPSSTGATSGKVDIVIGCAVGSPAVYLGAILARKSNTLIKVFSHSSNTASVDSGITNKLLKVNRHESEVTGVNIIYKDTSAAYFVDKPGRQVPVFGLSNILRYLARSQGYTALYNEGNLNVAAAIDEMLAMVDSLEMKSTAQMLNEFVKIRSSSSSTYLCGDTLSIADIALCCCLTASVVSEVQIPRVLREYLDTVARGEYEMLVLKAFINGN